MKTLHSIDPVVETAWLAESLSRPGLIVIDIRPEEEYSSGHIPGALNLPFAAWKTGRDGLELELPDEAVLFDLLGQAGITPDGAIVIVHNVDNSYPLADACRVADTLIYCGCDSVGILNGGQRKWSEEKRALSKRRVKAKPVKYSHKTAKETFVTKDYVLKALGKAVILDTRDPDVYYGVRQEPHAKRPGHIPGARCLPGALDLAARRYL
jgi:thiosulfate/3-mercaptopyruvate sulfurtransferase